MQVLNSCPCGAIDKAINVKGSNMGSQGKKRGAKSSTASQMLSYRDCCQLLHEGQPAHSAEALMRSRYTAYALGLRDYLIHSWHPDYCPATLTLPIETKWRQLIINSQREQGDEGEVSFTAIYSQHDRWYRLEEASRFKKYHQHWKYTDGDAQWLEWQPGQNQPCPCGSGKKFKRCCK